MKSITIATSYYHPETGAAAKRLTAIAEYLAEHGWSVTVVTLLPNYPQNKIYAGFDGPTPRQSSENGVTVIRLRPWIVPKANLVLRLLSETLFSLQVAAHILRHKTAVVLTSTPYMFLGPLGLASSRLRGAKFVWDVRDLVWQYVKAIGKRSYGLDALLERLMKFTARKADALVTATNGQLPYFEKRPEYSLVVPNGLSDSMLAELAKAAPTSLFGQSPTKVLYAGLLGYAQGLTTLIRTAHLLPNIELRLVGDGPERALLEAEARALGLSNVQFEGYVSFNELIAHYAWADILVAHLRDNPVFDIAQPSKLWEYMATGKPVIYAGKGESVSLIQEHEAGACVPPDNPEALAEAIRGLASDPVGAAALGKRGREFVEIYRRRSVLLEQYKQLLEQLSSDAPQQTSESPPNFQP